jgi:hypothetical protein
MPHYTCRHAHSVHHVAGFECMALTCVRLESTDCLCALHYKVLHDTLNRELTPTTAFESASPAASTAHEALCTQKSEV